MPIDRCPYCHSQVQYTGQEEALKCVACGNTLFLTDFESHQKKINAEIEKGREAEKALAQAEAEKKEWQEQLLYALSSFDALKNAHKSESAQLDALFTALKDGQAEGSAALSQVLKVVLNTSGTTHDKLHALQNMAESILSSQQDTNDLQRKLTGVLDSLCVSAQDQYSVLQNFTNWFSAAHHQDQALLENISATASQTLSRQSQLDHKVSSLQSTADKTLASVRNFQGKYEQDKIDRLHNLYKQADQLYADRKFDQADEYYRKILVSGEESAEVYWRLIMCHYGGVYEKAPRSNRYELTLKKPNLNPCGDIARLRACNLSAEQKKEYERRLKTLERLLDDFRRNPPKNTPSGTPSSPQPTPRKPFPTAAAVAAVAVLVIAAAVYLFAIRPAQRYNTATAHFISGSYENARSEYDALGSHKDAAMRVLLCDAMIALQNGASEQAEEAISLLLSRDLDASAGQLSQVLLPLISGWQENGLTPQALLLLLTRADALDPAGTLDVPALYTQGHMALLDGTQLDAYADDVDNNGENELIVLGSDYAVAVYRMTDSANVRMAVDNATAAACETAFGHRLIATDPTAAVQCFVQAYLLSPNDATRTDLAGAYRTRALHNENEGHAEDALADARSALDTSGAAEDFDFFYDINLRICRTGRSALDAVVLWQDFAVSAAPDIALFTAQDRWTQDCAQLYISLALEQAVQKDASCVQSLETAAGMGADITDAIAEARSHFSHGLSLAQLRLLEISQYAEGSEAALQARDAMEDEVASAITGWEQLGVPPADIPALIYLADRENIALTGIDRAAVYQKAALAAVGTAHQTAFVDWDNNGYQELLTLSTGGTLALHGVHDAWSTLASVDTQLSAAAFTIVQENAPLVLVAAADGSELHVIAADAARLAPLFVERSIHFCTVNGTNVTFSRKLNGSIDRYEEYLYEAADTLARPVRTGVNYQQHNYPHPAAAQDAIQRYFEARAYGIADECQLLTAASAQNFFSADFLAALPAPDAPAAIRAAAYLTTDNRELFEVAYTSGARNIRTWVSADYINGWKVTGAAASFAPAQSSDAADYSIGLLSLNSETSHTLAAKGDSAVYRLLIPASGRINLGWISGDKNDNRTSHTVSMHQGALSGDTVFSYDLQPSLNRQQSRDLFVAPGVYYVSVAAQIKNAAPYRLSILYTADPHVELENNDTYAVATPIMPNTTYTGVLSRSNDVDFYAFTLSETSAVNIVLGASGNGGKSPAYACTLYAADGSRLTALSLSGNQQRTESGSVYLASGTYYAEVTKGSVHLGDAYTLHVDVSSASATEAESNNTMESANPIAVNTDVLASFALQGDVDYYTFTLPQDAVIQPKISFKPTDNSARTYVITIVDHNRQEMLKASIGGKETAKSLTPSVLTKGTYTVKVENPRFVQQEYTLNIACMPVDAAESEPNNSAALAAELLRGAPRTGVLSSEEDVDYYRLVFKEQTNVTLNFSFARSTVQNTAYVLAFESNGKTLQTFSVKGDSGGTSLSLQFNPGEYYIKLKPSVWLSAVYTLGIE